MSSFAFLMELNPLIQSRRRNLFRDISLWVLLFSNLLVIYFAIKEHQNIITLMWIYWTQSVTIGIFNFVRILSLKEFSTKNFFINDFSVAPTRNIKIKTAFVFLFHYGLFHIMYLTFLMTKSANIDKNFILYSASLFFINHFFSFLYNRSRDAKKQNIGILMVYPYARIIPMHLMTFIAPIFGNIGIIFFVPLKTLADVAMHAVEHKLKDGEKQMSQI